MGFSDLQRAIFSWTWMYENPASAALWIVLLIYVSNFALGRTAALFGKRRRYVVHEQLPKDLIAGADKWANLHKIEKHVDAIHKRSCADMVVIHEQICDLDPEYVNLFTVQHNLFASALLRLSSDLVHHKLGEAAKAGKVRGAFALTERGAGVYSGAVVKTECKLVEGEFEINTPDASADKVWISYANDGTVTHLIVFVKFLAQDKRDNLVVPLLIPKATKGVKVTAYVKDLQAFKLNSFGCVTFDRVRVPVSSLLNRFMQWDAPTSRFLFQGDRRQLLYKLFERLLVGRLVLSATSVSAVFKVAELVRHHAVARGFWANKAIQNKIVSAQDECASMQDKIVRMAHKLDNESCETWEINYIKATVPVRCRALLSELGMYLGGFVLQDSCPVLNLHASVYGGIVAEGDSQILRQAVMRDLLLCPWRASWDPAVWLACLVSAAGMMCYKDKIHAWNQYQPLLNWAFDRLAL